MKSIDKRVRELRRAVEGVLNTYGLPLSIDELVLEGLLSTVRAQMERDSDPEEAENGKPKQSCPDRTGAPRRIHPKRPGDKRRGGAQELPDHAAQ